jgi:hypothetical protein
MDEFNYISFATILAGQELDIHNLSKIEHTSRQI